MKIVLEPGASFKERGISIPQISEADISDIVIKACSDSLEEFGVEHSRLFSPMEKVGVGELAIQISVGYDEKQKSKNASVVEGEGELALLLGETLAEWGRCFSFGHQIKTREGPTPSRVRLELFAINGIDAEQYLCRLSQLGREIAQSVASFTIQAQQARQRPVETPAKIPDSLRQLFDFS